MGGHYLSPSLSSWQPPVCFLSLWICLLEVFRINEMRRFMPSSFHTHSMFPGLTHVVAGVCT